MEKLSEEERRALRGSKFAPLPPPSSLPSQQQPRLAHPGGPLTTNKATALAKFLERKLQDPSGLASLNPDLIELAVKNAKDTLNTSGTSNSGRRVTHVTSFSDSEDSLEEVKAENPVPKKQKKKKRKTRKKKNKKQKMEDVGSSTFKRPIKKS